MINKFQESALIDGDPAAVWRVAADPARWGTWDPHVLQCGFDGPFEVGATGWTISRIVPQGRGHFTVVEVSAGRSFTTRSPMPLGKMLIVNRYESAAPGKVRVSRRVEVHGGFAPIFGYAYAERFRRDTRITFTALAREVALRAAGTEEAP